MGEQPVFTSHAHVFAIDPQTKKSWIHVSNQAVDVSFFYDPIRECYRIISVDDSGGTKRVVVHSSITEKMVFKQTSQKFGQWTDTKANQVYGLGFADETELQKFVAQFNYAVEAAARKAAISGEHPGVMLRQEISNDAQQKNLQGQMGQEMSRMALSDGIDGKDAVALVRQLETQNAQLRAEVESLREQLECRDQRILQLRLRLKQQVQSLVETTTDLDAAFSGAPAAP